MIDIIILPLIGVLISFFYSNKDFNNVVKGVSILVISIILAIYVLVRLF